jgi:hypothetical protein
MGALALGSRCHHSSLPGLTRQSIRFAKSFLRRMMDPRVITASTRVFDALLPAAHNTCFPCHEIVKARDLVFNRYAR